MPPEADASEGRTQTTDLVSGDSGAIQECLAWLQALDRQVHELALAVEPVIHADLLRPKARVVLLTRLAKEASRLRDLLLNDKYKEIISPAVTAWVEPVLQEAAEACFRLARAACWKQVPVDDLPSYLTAIRSPAGELCKLQELLVYASLSAVKGERARRRPDAVAVPGRKGKQINERMLAELQRNPDSLSWSARKWADVLECSPGTIGETPTWRKVISAARAIERAERETRQERSQRRSDDD
jgi:hypothetical protein